jgi:transcriptional regulator with XRE-family HTH domain
MRSVAIVSRHQAARAIKQLRLERGLSLGQLAIRCGISPSTVCYRERGDRAMRVEAYAATAEALGYRVALVPTRAAQIHAAAYTGTGWPA